MRIVVEERGSGPRTLLSVHGLGASRDHFYAVADRLDGRFRCLLPDLRGHGDSPPGPVERTQDFAADLLATVREAAPVTLCGLSLGADIVRLIWDAEPSAVEAVVLVDPMLDLDSLWRWARDRTSTPEEATRLVVAPFREDDLEQLVALMAEYPLTAGLDEAGRRRNARSHLRADRETLWSALRAPGERLPGRPRRSGARALIVRARRSTACPLRKALPLAVRLRARIVAVDSGHCVSLDAPEELAAILLRRLG